MARTPRKGDHVEWSTPQGKTTGTVTKKVTGTAEALLMAIAGRRVALADLSGSGVETLRDRLAG